MSIVEKIGKLREQIEKANRAYYVRNDPIMDDYTFDQLVRELQDLENLHPQYKTATSPTEMVGGGFSTVLTKVPHTTKMLSLDNIYNRDEFLLYGDVLSRYGIDPTTTEFYCNLKMDGLSLSLVYNLQLTCAITRGDGSIGENVTQNIYDLGTASIPRKIPPISTVGSYLPVIIRGECIVNKSDFIQINSYLRDINEKEIATPRHMAAALLRTLPKHRKFNIPNVLQFYPYALDDMNFYNKYQITTYSDMITQFDGLKFSIIPGKLITGLPAVWEYYESISKTRGDLPYVIDGIVIRPNQFKLQDKMGTTNKVPKYAMALKFLATKGTSVVKDILWQVGKSGIITPVVLVNPPINMDGVLVTRATLHNEDFIKQLDIRIGDTITIERSGDVIPKVTTVDTVNRAIDSQPYESPKVCPECGSMLIRSKDISGLYCSNTDCPAVIVGQLILAASRVCYNFVGMGDIIVKDLYLKQYIRNPIDFFKLQLNDLLNCGIGEKRSSALIKVLQERKQSVKLDKHLFALCIKGLGSVLAKNIAMSFGSLRAIECASVSDLMKIPLVGEVVANNIVRYFSSVNLSSEYDNLGLCTTMSKSITREDTIFSGKKIKVTGTFPIPRTKLLSILEEAGAVPTSAISKLDYLIVGESASDSKVKEARSRSIRIVDVDQLQTILSSL